MLMELKENMTEEVKESIMTMPNQIKIINRRKEILKYKHMEIVELKSKIIKIKNSLEGLYSRLELAELVNSRLMDTDYVS